MRLSRFLAVAILGFSARAQTPAAPVQNNAAPAERIPKRIFGIIPNFRTSTFPDPYKPIPAGQKFNIAVRDSFDRGPVILAAAFAGVEQAARTEPSYGQGVEGYSKYFAASYAGIVTGNLMTEAVFPTLFHQDPRYFRRGKGSSLSRVGYAMGQTFVTHSDFGGHTVVNISELGGNATAVAIAQSWSPGTRRQRRANLVRYPDRHRHGREHP